MADKLSAAEALYGFGGWLTTREEPMTFSAHHDAGLMANLIQEFCEANSLVEPRAHWVEGLTMPDTRESWRDKAKVGS